MADNNNSLKAPDTTKRRSHSNTISGGRPPAIETSRPVYVRRNSEGSPSVPPPIHISEPTPIEPSDNEKNGFFNNSVKDYNDSLPPKPITPIKSESSVSSRSTSPIPPAKPDLPDTPPIQQNQKTKNRSRASSVTSNLINELKENSTIQSFTKFKSRHSEDLGSDVNNDSSASVSASVSGASGVYFANLKKNQDFHALFRSVPEEDCLVEDFGCALQKEILLQGRIYISESHLCFNANIFGWVTNLVIAFADIVSIERKSTAIIIPNAIQISTENAKHFFASFLSRDQAYDLMVDIWRIARPDLANKDGDHASSQMEDEMTSEGSTSNDEEDSDSYYDSESEGSFEDDTSSEEVQVAPESSTAQGSAAGSKNDNRARKHSMASLPSTKDDKGTDAAARRRAMSEAPKPTLQPNASEKNDKSGTPPAQKAEVYGDTPPPTPAKTEDKPQAHEKTKCECAEDVDHFPNVVMDHVYNGTIEQLYNLLFQNEDGFMKKFLIDNQKSLEFSMGEWKKGEGDIISVRELSYIKQLGGAIGPKQTKCYITQEVLHQDLEKSVTVLTTTSTPDVPSGGSFSCKTKTCFTWAGQGKVRVLVTVLVDFTKSSWLKSTIEKASIDGQQTYFKDLDAEIRAYLKDHPSGPADGAQPSGQRRRRKGKKSKSSTKHRHHQPEEKTTEKSTGKEQDTAIHRALNGVSNLIADAITGLIDIFRSPKSSHLTLLCLIIMVFINIHVARKMSFVERQLSELSQQAILSGKTAQETEAAPGSVLRNREYNREGEEEELWEWLSQLDPSSEVREPVQSPAAAGSEEEVYDDAIQISKDTKERLDKHMIELSEMIQKAEINLNDITRAVKEQRNKIKQA